MTRGGRVCVVGAVNADLLIHVAPGLSTPGYSQATQFSTLAGGKGLNTALNMAALAPQAVGFVGRVGNDLYGDFLDQIVAESALEAVSLTRDPIQHTGIGHVRVQSDGEYDTVVLPGANATLGDADIDLYSATHPEVLGWVSNLETPLAWWHRAKELYPHTSLALNLSPLTGDVSLALDVADVIVLNSVEARQVTQSAADETVSKLLGKMRTLTSATIVITAGPDGAEALTPDGDLFTVDARPVQVATTVGAGDAFFATLSLAMTAGIALDIALELAAEAGSLVASSYSNFLTEASASSLANAIAQHTSSAAIR